MVDWTTDPRKNFTNTFLSESPMGIAEMDMADKIKSFINEYKQIYPVINLNNGLRKIDGDQIMFYWFEDTQGKMTIGAELEKSPFVAIVREVGKYNKGQPPYASDLYAAILTDLHGSLRLTSDKQLTGEGLGIWKRLLSQGYKIGAYDSSTPGQTFTRIRSEEELERFYKFGDRSYLRHQYIISEHAHSVEIWHHFELRRFRELNPILL